jgi:hypothetical protein
MMISIRHPFSIFAPKITPLLRKNQYQFRLNSLDPPFHYSRTHYSNIPLFQHSNWGEALNLKETGGFKLQQMLYGIVQPPDHEEIDIV